MAEKYKVKNPAAAYSDSDFQEIKRRVENAVTAKENPKEVLAYLQRKHQEEIHRYAWPGTAGVPDRKLIRIVFRRGNLEPVKLYWEFLPHPVKTILGLCPLCYLNAPSQVDTKTATKPTLIDGMIARIQGNPEADKKLVPFSLAEPQFNIHYSMQGRRDLLTVDQVIRCPEFHRCSFAVRLEDSIATLVSPRLVGSKNSSKGGPIKGPLVIVK